MSISVDSNDLMCPITLDWLDDPIVLGCCGKAISRKPLLDHLDNSNLCPCCNDDISNIDFRSIPKAVNIAYMVEQIKNKEKKPITKKISGIIHKIYDNKDIIGKLVIDSKGYDYKTLFLIVVDKSGSMSGSPIKQCQYALNLAIDLTYKSNHLLTNIITYSNYANNLEIDISNPQNLYKSEIAKLEGTNGTSFSAAFDEIVKVCEKHKNNNNISSAVILFLTDGEDMSSTNRLELVNILKNKLDNIWSKPYIVHTIGFGAQHDFKFLDALRQINKDGVYRYADPRENDDILSSKINSILQVVAKSSNLPIKICQNNIPIICGGNNIWWFDLTGSNPIQNLEIMINNEQTILNCEYAEDENNKNIFQEWYSILIDDIATELNILSSQPDSLEKQLHCELLEHRTKAISIKLDDTTPNLNRLEKLIATLKTIKKGESVDRMRLNDIKAEGKFETKSITPSTVQPIVQPKPIKHNIQTKKRCIANKKSPEFMSIITRYKNQDIKNWVETTNINQYDNKNNNLIGIAASIGRCYVVKILMDTELDINHINNNGNTALDLAILYGYWKTFDILISKNAKTNRDGQELLKICLNNCYYNTAERLINNKISILTDDIYNTDSNSLSWLSKFTQHDIPIEMAITKGVFDIVIDKIDDIEHISWQPYLDIFGKKDENYIKIVDVLLKNGKADADEIIMVNDEITWPLFIACEKGNLEMVKELLIFNSKEMLNFQNHKGTTILWIAACNNHIDIVTELINLVDINMPNFKGDSPLIPACQRGNTTIVELLLESGIDIKIHNKNRDNAILISCRSGQAKILELLLKKLSQQERDQYFQIYADIDGFNPLLAATELDKTECIRVCLKYGADIESKTDNNNNIIKGATALHLACHYNRLASVKLLCENKADLLAQTYNGYTPLHIAVQKGDIHIIRYILSLPKGQESLSIPDNSGRIPEYYASMIGNENIKEEFFTDKLAISLSRVLVSNTNTESNCIKILQKYGKSLCCYGYDNVINKNLWNGGTLLTYSLLTGRTNLFEKLIKMGGDINKGDDYGVTPLFWMNFMGIGNTEPDQKIKDMLERVNRISKNNIQNKMLLKLQEPSQEIYQNNNGLITNKMNNGYGALVSTETLNGLLNLCKFDQSVLSFMDKFKKSFSDKNYLKYLIWDSVINLIKRIAIGEDILQPVHILSIYMYTSCSEIYENVNNILIKGDTKNYWMPFITCLYQGLNLIPNYNGEVYRGIDILFNKQDYEINKKIIWNTFSVTTKQWKTCSDLINNGKGIIFIIKSKTGKPISKYSKYPVDDEVIFLPGTEFIITNHYSPNIICLGQANIRNSTFKIKDKDYEKAENGKAAIIIELTEN